MTDTTEVSRYAFTVEVRIDPDLHSRFTELFMDAMASVSVTLAGEGIGTWITVDDGTGELLLDMDRIDDAIREHRE
jgi:hypothetical protein